MRIKSNLSGNFFKVYFESRAYAEHKSDIYKKNKLTRLNIIEEKLLYSSILFLIGLYIVLEPKILYIYGYLVFFIDILYLFYNVIRIYEGYKFRKKKKFISEMEFNDKGIIDYSSFDGVEITFKWDIIDFIAIGKYSVTVFTNRKIYFYFDKKDKNRIIKEVKNYKPDIKILEA